MTESPDHNKSLMRNLGEFFGHIAKGIRTDPARDASSDHGSDHGPDQASKQEVNRTVEEKRDGNVIYRRTTIDEVEIQRDHDSSSSAE